jgi:copper(I)-binding protein
VKQTLILILAMVMLLSACGAEKGIEIHEVWMRPTAQGDNGAVYFVLHNHSSEADEMTDASSDVAEAVEMHESKVNSDIMEMNRVKTIPLDAYAEIDFAPGKFHIMLVNLKRTLKVGDEIEITLHFKNFEDIHVKVPLRDAPAPEEDHSSTNH